MTANTNTKNTNVTTEILVSLSKKIDSGLEQRLEVAASKNPYSNKADKIDCITQALPHLSKSTLLDICRAIYNAIPVEVELNQQTGELEPIVDSNDKVQDEKESASLELVRDIFSKDGKYYATKSLANELVDSGKIDEILLASPDKERMGLTEIAVEYIENGGKKYGITRKGRKQLRNMEQWELAIEAFEVHKEQKEDTPTEKPKAQTTKNKRGSNKSQQKSKASKQENKEQEQEQKRKTTKGLPNIQLDEDATNAINNAYPSRKKSGILFWIAKCAYHGVTLESTTIERKAAQLAYGCKEDENEALEKAHQLIQASIVLGQSQAQSDSKKKTA